MKPIDVFIAEVCGAQRSQKTYSELLIDADNAMTLADVAMVKIELMLRYGQWSQAELRFAQEHLRDLAVKIMERQ